MSLNIPYAFPPPVVLGLGNESTLGQICTEFQTRFAQYKNFQTTLLNQLNAIYGSSISFDANRNLNLTQFIKSVCIDSEEANRSYKFYGCKIIDQINRLGNYICEAEAILRNSAQLQKDPHTYVVHMEMLDQFCHEISDTFSVQYQYDFDEDTWGPLYDAATQLPATVDKNAGFPGMQNLQVNADQKGTTVKKQIEIFKELNLLDRLKYIKMYYDVAAGKSDSVFPESIETGFPCVKEDFSKNAYNEVNKKIAALEQFYIGYLIDRDGAANAVASFFDIKMESIKYNIELYVRQVNALNQYLKWINRGLEIYNQGQSNGDAAIPSGAYMVMVNICNSIARSTMQLDMNGDGKVEEYFIVQYASGITAVDDYHLNAQNRYVLLPVDGTAMDYILNGGNNPGSTNTDVIYFDRIFWDSGNTPLGSQTKRGDGYTIYNGFSYSNKFDCRNANQVYVLTFDSSTAAKSILPKEIDFRRIDPDSVKDLSNSKWREQRSGTESTARNKSWQDSFQSSIDAVNASLDTVQTDIQTLRSKIDTYTELANTFRNRSLEVYSKITTHIKG